MLAAINNGNVDLNVSFEALVTIAIEPGVWQTRHRGQEFSVTSLRARLTGGHLYFAYPKGVPRRLGGDWAAQERTLADLFPAEPLKAWAMLPEAVRDALEDAYLLARHELPERLGRP